MKKLRCVCTFATDEEWLSVKIVVWFSVAVIACLMIFLITLKIKDCLEMRHHIRRQRGRAQRNNFEEERFEEIRDN